MPKKTLMFGIMTLISIIALIAVGCSDDETGNPASSNDDTGATVEIARITPADGSTAVATTASISVKFTGPVDTNSVMQNMYLAGGNPMHEWRDSLNHYGGFGMMGSGMQDHMWNWMDSIHLAGDYHWNNALDSCEFFPGDTLMPNTEYLVLMYEGGMNDHHGGMMGGSNHGDSGYHMFSFTTEQGAVGSPQLMSSWPAHGSTGVPLSEMLALHFDIPMDTLSVMTNFHFIGVDELTHWMDSLDYYRGMGGMGMMYMDHMMNWLDSINLDGQFTWSGGLDSCQFLPDSSLMPGTEYMIFLIGNVSGQQGGMMGMEHLHYGGHMIHFTTEP